MGAVLLGALMHAAWNALVKSGDDKLLDTTLVTAGAAALGLVAVPFLPLPAAASWPHLAASVTLHCAYFSLVAAAYRSGDLSLSYPVMRGTAPFVTALFSWSMFSERYAAVGWAGIAMLSAGILLLAVEAGRHRAHQGQSVAFGVLNAAVIVAYTLVDGSGVRLAGNAWSYAAWLFVLNAPPLLVLLRFNRGPAFLQRANGRHYRPLAGGVFTFASYGLALWAMTHAPIALVAALRESAVVFGLVLAALLLKERFGPARWAASILVAAGAGALKLA